jgi:hypothetical protein
MGDWEAYLHAFLASELDGGGRFNLGGRILGMHWIGDWVGPRAGSGNEEKISL